MTQKPSCPQPPDLSKTVGGILFDVDGTLYHARRLRIIIAVRLLLHCALHPGLGRREVRAIQHFRRAQETLREKASRALSHEIQVRHAAETSGLSEAFITETVEKWMEQAPLRILRSCARTNLILDIERWHRRGVPMGVFSDYPAAEKLEHMGLGFLAPFAVCSTEPEVGAFKPNPKGFLVAAERIGVDPKQAVYVGDREEVDGEGAANAGMRCLLVGRHHAASARVGLATLDAAIDRDFAEQETGHAD